MCVWGGGERGQGVKEYNISKLSERREKRERGRGRGRGRGREEKLKPERSKLLT